MSAVKQNGQALGCASGALKNDRQIVMKAVEQSGLSLRYASAALQGDPEIVMAAVQQDGDALFFASAELKGDREIVMAAVAQSAEALQYVSDELCSSGLISYLDGLIKDVFNVPWYTIVATILFGAKAAAAETPDKSNCILSLLQPSARLPGPFSTQIKQLIWAYAGVKSGQRWRTIESAAKNLSKLEGKQPSP